MYDWLSLKNNYVRALIQEIFLFSFPMAKIKNSIQVEIARSCRVSGYGTVARRIFHPEVVERGATTGEIVGVRSWITFVRHCLVSLEGII